MICLQIFCLNFYEKLIGICLATALVSVTEELYHKLMSVLPERMQSMIQSNIAAKQNIPQNEVEEAQKKLLQEVRKELRAFGGRKS